MLEINRILIQLNKAVDAANSEFPQERGIAITLFDNLIEVQLFKKAEIIFLFDRTTWYKGNRKFNYKTRNSSLGYYDSLLKFSKNNGIITESDFEILKYAHSIRNSVFHNGVLNNLKLDLAILIFYDFVNRNITKWGSPLGLICYKNSPGYEKIDFGQGLGKNKISLGHKDYFDEAVGYILGKIKIRSGLNEKVQNILETQIERIKDSIEFINSESKTLNFYDVLGRYWYLNDDFFNFYKSGRNPKNLDSILLLYGFLRENKEYLDDIEELKRRQTKGKKLLRKYRSQKNEKYPHWTDIKNIEKRILKLNGLEPDKVLKNLIDIENKISYLYSDLDQASSDLDLYIQELIDIEREK
ncbi:MAG: hypothetical protein HOO91_16920 [Bacteroidales bacterium]|nr:hypothetical protein [Bacteroidales bacterium]